MNGTNAKRVRSVFSSATANIAALNNAREKNENRPRR